MKQLSLLVLIALLVVVIPATTAKGVVGVDITAPGEDACPARDVQLFEEMMYHTSMGTPLTIIDLEQDFYEIRLLIGHEKQVVAADIFRYYPNEPGYLYYADVENGWSSAEGEWFSIDVVFDDKLRALLEAPCVVTYTTLDYLALAGSNL